MSEVPLYLDVTRGDALGLSSKVEDRKIYSREMAQIPVKICEMWVDSMLRAQGPSRTCNESKKDEEGVDNFSPFETTSRAGR